MLSGWEEWEKDSLGSVGVLQRQREGKARASYMQPWETAVSKFCDSYGKLLGLGCDSVSGHLPSMYQALDLAPSTSIWTPNFSPLWPELKRKILSQWR